MSFLLRRKTVPPPSPVRAQEETLSPPRPDAPNARNHRASASSLPLPPPPPPSSHRNVALDGLRGFSAGSVLIAHILCIAAALGFLPVRDDAERAGVVASAFHAAGGAVALFFLLSGYLIVQSLAGRLRRGEQVVGGGTDTDADAKPGDVVRAFLKDRAIRLYPVFVPLHLVAFTLGPLMGERMQALQEQPWWVVTGQFVANLLFLPGSIGPEYLLLAQRNAWSLSFELFFYLTACQAFMAWARLKKRGQAGRTTLQTVGALLLLAWTGAGAAFYISVHPRAVFFAIGTLIYVLHRRRREPHGRAGAAGASPALFPAWTGFLAPLALVGVLFFITHTLWAAALLGFFVLDTVAAERGPLTAFLRTRSLRYLGRISYSLYLIHPFVITPVGLLARRVAVLMHLPGSVALTLVFCVAAGALSVGVAHLSHQWIEVAFTNRFLRRGRSK